MAEEVRRTWLLWRLITSDRLIPCLYLQTVDKQVTHLLVILLLSKSEQTSESSQPALKLSRGEAEEQRR